MASLPHQHFIHFFSTCSFANPPVMVLKSSPAKQLFVLTLHHMPKNFITKGMHSSKFKSPAPDNLMSYYL